MSPLTHRKVDQLLTDWDWSAPQIDIPLTFDKFLRYCSEAEKPSTSHTHTTTTTTTAAETTTSSSLLSATTANNKTYSTSSRPLHYMTISAGEGLPPTQSLPHPALYYTTTFLSHTGSHSTIHFLTLSHPPFPFSLPPLSQDVPHHGLPTVCPSLPPPLPSLSWILRDIRESIVGLG